jgi:hypothetical protein
MGTIKLKTGIAKSIMGRSLNAILQFVLFMQ